MFYGCVLHAQGVDLSLPGIIQQIGLLLFIFTIGIQAAPSFFEALSAILGEADYVLNLSYDALNRKNNKFGERFARN